MTSLSDWLLGVTWQSLAAVAVTTPLVFLAARRALPRWKDLLLLAIFFWAALALAHSANGFTLIPAPWQGMLLEAIFALLVILALRMPRQAGLTLRISARNWRDALLATFLLLVFTLLRSLGLSGLGIGNANGTAPTANYLLYLATIPGIAEELAYRGVIQPRLNMMFGTPWNLFGAQVGWGFVVTAVLFWAIHAFRVDADNSISFYWPTLTMQLWAGLVFGWIREKTGSIFPGIICHNCLNVVWAML